MSLIQMERLIFHTFYDHWKMGDTTIGLDVSINQKMNQLMV